MFLLIGILIGPGMLVLVDIKTELSINRLILIFGIPVVVALLLDMKAPGAQLIASVTFIAILIQATTNKWLARKLDLLVEE